LAPKYAPEFILTINQIQGDTIICNESIESYPKNRILAGLLDLPREKSVVVSALPINCRLECTGDHILHDGFDLVSVRAAGVEPVGADGIVDDLIGVEFGEERADDDELEVFAEIVSIKPVKLRVRDNFDFKPERVTIKGPYAGSERRMQMRKPSRPPLIGENPNQNIYNIFQVLGPRRKP
jgi:hypothetical protein